MSLLGSLSPMTVVIEIHVFCRPTLRSLPNRFDFHTQPYQQQHPKSFDSDTLTGKRHNVISSYHKLNSRLQIELVARGEGKFVSEERR